MFELRIFEILRVSHQDVAAQVELDPQAWLLAHLLSLPTCGSFLYFEDPKVYIPTQTSNIYHQLLSLCHFSGSGANLLGSADMWSIMARGAPSTLGLKAVLYLSLFLSYFANTPQELDLEE